MHIAEATQAILPEHKAQGETNAGRSIDPDGCGRQDVPSEQTINKGNPRAIVLKRQGERPEAHPGRMDRFTVGADTGDRWIFV